jgi:Reverse transcriptase (RNA-dependent DNA polymerase)
VASFAIECRVSPKREFLITDMRHDVIIGLERLAQFTAGLDPRARKRLWPSVQPAIPNHSVPIHATQATGLFSIPFPADKDPEHISLVRARLPSEIHHLEGFFSKKQAHRLPDFRGEGKEVVLELAQDLPNTAPPLWRAPPHLMALTRQVVNDLLVKGFIRRCQETWAVPTLFVPTANGERRFCCDYRQTKRYLKSKDFPAPQLSDTLHSIRRSKVFTKINIQQAFHRLRLAPGLERITAFKTRYGTFEWLVLPCGLKVGPEWVQQFIHDQLNLFLDRNKSAYADDVLTHSTEL